MLTDNISRDAAGALLFAGQSVKELADRYGRLPPAATRLVRLAEFRVRCAAKRVARLDVKGTRAVFYLQGSRDPSFVERVQGNTADRKISSLFKMLEGDW